MAGRIMIFLFLILLAAWLQGGYFTIAGIKPNFLLAVFIALSFLVKNFWTYGILSVVGMIALRSAPVFSWDLVSFLLVLTALFFFRRFLPWHDVINFIAAATFATALLYLLLDPSFIAWHPFLVSFELFLTLAMGGAMLLLLHRYAEEPGLRF